MSDRQLRLRLGIFAVLALVLLAALVLLFGSLPTLFKRTNEYTITFTDAPGLRPGSPVRRSGVRVGEVKDLALDDATGKVNVHIELDKNFTVRENERPTLIISLLGSDASIDFIPNEKDPDRSVIPPGSVVVGNSPVSINTLLNRASEVVPTTQKTLDDMSKSLKRLEEMTPLIEQTLQAYRDLGRKANDDFPALSRSLKGTSDDAGATARQWRQLGENLNVLLLGNQDKITKSIENLNITLERVQLLMSDGNIKNVAAILENMRDVSSRAISIAKNLQDASDRVPGIVKNIDEASARLPDISKNVQLAVEDAPAISKNLRAASDDLPTISKNTRAASEKFPSMAMNADELLKEARPALARLQPTLAKAEAAMADVQKVTGIVGDRGPSIAKNLDESLDKLNRTMTDVRELMRVLDQSDGTIKKLLTDPSLYNNVDQTACAIAKLMPRLDRILKDLETFADKLARHPELIGASGAIKHSDGLKDPEPINPHPQH